VRDLDLPALEDVVDLGQTTAVVVLAGREGLGAGLARAQQVALLNELLDALVDAPDVLAELLLDPGVLVGLLGQLGTLPRSALHASQALERALLVAGGNPQRTFLPAPLGFLQLRPAPLHAAPVLADALELHLGAGPGLLGVPNGRGYEGVVVLDLAHHRVDARGEPRGPANEAHDGCPSV
jgi:hypothetical protein